MTTPKDGDREIGTKALGPMEIVDDAKGEVTAVVYVLGEVDRDRDVILPGAFQSGVHVKLSGYGHSAILAQIRGTGQPVEAPVGKGVITINGNRAVFRGNFFMSTERGREAYATTKEMGPEQEWSFSYWIRDRAPADEKWRAKGAKFMLKSIDPFEASPVTVSSSLGTSTVGVKCSGCGEPHDGEVCAPCAAKAAELAAKEQEATVDAAVAIAARDLVRPTDGRVYISFDDCVVDNPWSDDPAAFCASLEPSASAEARSVATAAHTAHLEQAKSKAATEQAEIQAKAARDQRETEARAAAAREWERLERTRRKYTP